MIHSSIGYSCHILYKWYKQLYFLINNNAYANMTNSICLNIYHNTHMQITPHPPAGSHSIMISNMTCLTSTEYLCHKWPPGYAPLVVSTSRSFPHSWLITGFVTRESRQMPLEEQTRLILRSTRVHHLFLVGSYLPITSCL